VSTLLFGHKHRFQVDLGDLQNEKEHLAIFLQSNLDVPVASIDHKLIVDSEKLTVLLVQQAVTKYVHRHNLSRTHWVSAQNDTVKINRFKGAVKKKEKHGNSTPHQSITQSWGL